MADTKAPVARPLSPHLQIYRPTLTMMMSIAHRITGVGLYVGTLLVACSQLVNVCSPPFASVSVILLAFATLGEKSSGVPSRVRVEACTDQPNPAEDSLVSIEL